MECAATRSLTHSVWTRTARSCETSASGIRRYRSWKPQRHYSISSATRSVSPLDRFRGLALRGHERVRNPLTKRPESINSAPGTRLKVTRLGRRIPPIVVQPVDETDGSGDQFSDRQVVERGQVHGDIIAADLRDAAMAVRRDSTDGTEAVMALAPVA